MEPTLDLALARLFGSRAAQSPSPAPEGAAPGPATPAAVPPGAVSGATRSTLDPALVAEARAHYTRAIEAQRAGDWARYGDEIKALGAALDRLRER
jgi:uncharacterized membrane protein (UPF0182 family)